MMNRDPNGWWEAEFWDDFIQEFGIAAYIQVRYVEGRSPSVVEEVE